MHKIKVCIFEIFTNSHIFTTHATVTYYSVPAMVCDAASGLLFSVASVRVSQCVSVINKILNYRKETALQGAL